MKEGHASTSNELTNERWRKQKRRLKCKINHHSIYLNGWITWKMSILMNISVICNLNHIFWICFFFLKIKKITNEIQNFPFVQRKQPCALKLRFKFPSRMPHCVCIFVWNVFHWCLVGSAVASLPVNLLTKRTLQSQKTDSSVEWNVWFNQAVVQRCVCVHARLLSLSLFLLHPCVPKYTHRVVCCACI